MSEPVCYICGSDDIVHDRREGHVVCNNCGTVLEEHTVCDDPYEASTRCAPWGGGGWDLGTGNAPRVHAYVAKRRKDVRYAMKQKIANVVAVHGLGAAISSTADDMLDALDEAHISESELMAWALIALACESVKASRPINDTAACAGVSKKKLIDAMDGLRPGLSAFFDADADCNDLDTSLKRLLSDVFPMHEKVNIAEARKGATRIAGRLKGDGRFMNMCASTQARVLLLAHFDAAGTALSPAMKAVLKVSSSAKAWVTKIAQRS